MNTGKKLMSFLLTLCLLVSVIVPFSASAEEADNTADGAVINVTDYGADPTGAQDSAKAIQDAIAAAKELAVNGQHVTISFPKGRYDIYPDYAVKKELYITNTVGTDQNNKIKTIGILLEDIDNVTVEGNDSLFMFHGKMMTFAAIDCENVTFQNFDVDFQVPTVIDVTVEKLVGNNQAVIYIPECYNYSISGTNLICSSDASPYTGETYWSVTCNSITYTQRYDIKTGRTWRGSTTVRPAFQNVSKMEDLGDHRVQITYSTRSNELAAGMCYQMRPTVRDHSGTFFWKSKDVILRNLDIHFLHGFGMVGQSSENITLDNVDFGTEPGKGTTTAGYADFIQMSGCKGKIEIMNCTFANPHDDPINIHGTYMQVVGVNGNQVTVRYMHNETAGFPNFFVNDQVEFFANSTLTAVADSVRTVTAVDGPDGMGGRLSTKTGSLEGLTDITLTLDRAVSGITAGSSYVVENITYTPEVHIHDNIFKETPTRGILVTTRKKVLIEDNIFDGMGMAGIYISNDAKYPNGWYESGHNEDVTIKNNIFMRGQAQAILVEPTAYPNSNTNTVHKNFTIEGNTFFLENIGSNPVLTAISVNNLVIKNNRIYRQNPGASITASVTDGNSVAVGGTKQINVTTNGGNSLSTAVFGFTNCTATIEGNIYDGGINANYTGNGSSVTINNDAASSRTTTAKVGTVYYESSNNSVATVSSNGTISGVRAGTAQITAYFVCGDRRYDADPITVTVTSNGSSVAVPTAIKINEDSQVMDIDGSITFTADVTAPNGADASYTWSVVDPQTGDASDKATITNGGVLTATEGGVVEVVASTKANSLEARKLVVIKTSGMSLGDGFNVEYDTLSNAWEILDTNKIQIKAVNGGLWTSANPANLILKEFSNADTITATVKMSGKTGRNYDEAGLVFYNTSDNFVQIQRKHGGGSPYIALVRETSRENGNQSEAKQVTDNFGEDIYLKIEKNGGTFTGYYSTNGTEWTSIGTETNDILGSTFKIGFSVSCGQQNSAIGDSPTPFVFTELKVNDQNVDLTKELLPATLTGTPVIDSDTLTVDVSALTLSDPAASANVYWAVADSADGNYSVISGPASSSLGTVSTDMIGKYVKAAVVPANGNTAGSIYWTAPVQITGKEQTDSGAYAKTNANLKTASVGNLFNFTSGTYYYYTAVDTDVKSVAYSFAAEADDADVKVFIDGEETEGTSGTLNLHNAHNVIEVKVTANGGVTFKIYRFVISSTADNAKVLTSLAVNGDSIELEDGVYSYSYILDDNSDTATVTAVADGSASVAIIQNGAECPDGVVSIVPGSNIITIVVTPETQSAPTYYTLNIKVPDASNSYLESAEFSSGINLDGLFDKNTDEYTGTATNNKITITATAEEADADITVTLNGVEQGSGTGTVAVDMTFHRGRNTVEVEVSSPDGTSSKSYTFEIEGIPFVYLSDLDWRSDSTIGWNQVTIARDKEVEHGTPLSLWNGSEFQKFEKGIGTHATSDIYFDIAGKGYIGFESYAGVDEKANADGSVTFSVLIDNVQKAATSEMNRTTTMHLFQIDIGSNDQVIQLKADMGVNNSNDHADWTDAKFITVFNDEEEVIDKSALEAKIAEAEDIDLSLYTEETADVLSAALSAAKDVVADDGATQDEVDEALADLIEAIKALEAIEVPDYILGDVNKDGSITSLDATIVLQYAAGIVQETDERYEYGAADVSGDGAVTSLDATYILQRAAGLLENDLFPAEKT